MKKIALLILGLTSFIFLYGQDFKVKQQRIEELKQNKSSLNSKVDSLSSVIESIDLELSNLYSFIERKMILDTRGKGKLISRNYRLLLKEQPTVSADELLAIPENEKFILYYFQVGGRYYLVSYKGVLGYVIYYTRRNKE